MCVGDLTWPLETSRGAVSRGASSQLLAIGQGVGSSAAAAAAAAASAAGAGISSLLASRGRSTERQRPVTSVSGVGFRWVRVCLVQAGATFTAAALGCASWCVPFRCFLSSISSSFSLCQAGSPLPTSCIAPVVLHPCFVPQPSNACCCSLAKCPDKNHSVIPCVCVLLLALPLRVRLVRRGPRCSTWTTTGATPAASAAKRSSRITAPNR
jgi:hypothetical protein